MVWYLCEPPGIRASFKHIKQREKKNIYFGVFLHITHTLLWVFVTSTLVFPSRQSEIFKDFSSSDFLIEFTLNNIPVPRRVSTYRNMNTHAATTLDTEVFHSYG